MEKNNSNAGSVLKALVVGAVAGAAATYFSDKKNRDAAKKMIAELKETGKEKLSQVQKTINTKKEEAKIKLLKNLNKASKKVKSTS